ncbi:nose resistant to fluoxetine protein 6 [Caerostris extrusa]|uniref:Nose resistant to fluoxetine protein 6 n=1 Tax=Caerostris extrusa TaxID=172846 RepID=A0AAV4T3K6_CAEEX|nr:nose resistant to fluoxetine protein 6 [Caerostris extrusa]
MIEGEESSFCCDGAPVVVDATGKPPSGLFQGTSVALGDFDECINVRVGKNAKPPEPGQREYFHGKYCTVECKMPKGISDAMQEYEDASPGKKSNTSMANSKTFLRVLMKYGPFLKLAAFRLGVCIPSTCEVEDLSSITSTVARQIGFPISVLHCQEKEPIEFRTEQIIIIIVLLAVVLTVLFATTLHLYFDKFGIDSLSQTERMLQNVSQSISVINSTKEISRHQQRQPPYAYNARIATLHECCQFLRLHATVCILNSRKWFKWNGELLFIAGFLITFIRWSKSTNTPKDQLAQASF